MNNATTTCNYGYITVAGTLDSYPVVASSTCYTEVASTTTVPINYGDWLYMNSWILFCVAFIPISTLWGLLVYKKQR